MKRLALAVAALSIGLAALADGPETKAKKQKSDQDVLQGTWKVFKTESSEKDEPKAVIVRLEIEKSTYRMIFEIDGKKATMAEGTFKLNPAEKPKVMELTLVKSIHGPKDPAIGKTRFAIYALEGEVLVFSGQRSPGKPKDFTPRPDGDQTVWHLKREK